MKVESTGWGGRDLIRGQGNRIMGETIGHVSNVDFRFI